MLIKSKRRTGATVIECALVYPATFLLIIGLLVGGLGVFRYQETAMLAREAARYASVHGSQYQKDTGNPSPTVDQINTNVVQAMASGMTPQNLSVQVQWIDMNTGTATDWNSASKAPTTTSGTGQVISAHVRVTISYQWFPETFLAGPITLTSTCELPMSN